MRQAFCSFLGECRRKQTFATLISIQNPRRFPVAVAKNDTNSYVFQVQAPPFNHPKIANCRGAVVSWIVESQLSLSSIHHCKALIGPTTWSLAFQWLPGSLKLEIINTNATEWPQGLDICRFFCSHLSPSRFHGFKVSSNLLATLTKNFRFRPPVMLFTSLVFVVKSTLRIFICQVDLHYSPPIFVSTKSFSTWNTPFKAVFHISQTGLRKRKAPVHM